MSFLPGRACRVIERLVDPVVEIFEVLVLEDRDQVDERAARLRHAAAVIAARGDAVQEAEDFDGARRPVARLQFARVEFLDEHPGAQELLHVAQQLGQEMIRHGRESARQDVEVVRVRRAAHEVHDVRHVAEHDVVVMRTRVQDRLLLDAFEAAVDLLQHALAGEAGQLVQAAAGALHEVHERAEAVLVAVLQLLQPPVVGDRAVDHGFFDGRLADRFGLDNVLELALLQPDRGAGRQVDRAFASRAATRRVKPCRSCWTASATTRALASPAAKMRPRRWDYT